MSLDNARLIEISVQADREAVDDVVGLLSRHCSGGAAVDELRQGPEWPPEERILVKGFMDEHDQETLQKLEIALLLLSKTGVISEPATRLLEAADWAESWKAFFPPLPIGERFVVVPSWVEYEVPENRLPLYLDHGMAFGTGLHATTRLCLIAMESQQVSGARVLDVGTGSGICQLEPHCWAQHTSMRSMWILFAFRSRRRTSYETMWRTRSRSVGPHSLVAPARDYPITRAVHTICC